MFKNIKSMTALVAAAMTAASLAPLSNSTIVGRAVMPTAQASEVVISSGAAILLVLLTTTLVNSGHHHHDEVKAQSLLDQAAQAEGQGLSALSIATGQSVEAISDTINELAAAGTISASNPQQMEVEIARALGL